MLLQRRYVVFFFLPLSTKTLTTNNNTTTCVADRRRHLRVLRQLHRGAVPALDASRSLLPLQPQPQRRELPGKTVSRRPLSVSLGTAVQVCVHDSLVSRFAHLLQQEGLLHQSIMKMIKSRREIQTP